MRLQDEQMETHIYVYTYYLLLQLHYKDFYSNTECYTPYSCKQFKGGPHQYNNEHIIPHAHTYTAEDV